MVTLPLASAVLMLLAKMVLVLLDVKSPETLFPVELMVML